MVKTPLPGTHARWTNDHALILEKRNPVNPREIRFRSAIFLYNFNDRSFAFAQRNHMEIVRQKVPPEGASVHAARDHENGPAPFLSNLPSEVRDFEVHSCLQGENGRRRNDVVIRQDLCEVGHVHSVSNGSIVLLDTIVEGGLYVRIIKPYRSIKIVRFYPVLTQRSHEVRGSQCSIGASQVTWQMLIRGFKDQYSRTLLGRHGHLSLHLNYSQNAFAKLSTAECQS